MFGEYLDQTLPYDGMAHRLNLGDNFRTPPASKVPVLVFSGTLDGRTVLEDQRDALRALGNAVAITVENAGHNLFDHPSAEMLEVIDRFMREEPVGATTIQVELPKLAPGLP